ncbi:hypothetical protein GU700_05390 [Methylobacterium sp. NI91]|nr:MULTISPECIES: hypothetical protein [unclassified Methylobacterium]QIJ74062.1 hypothetical protein CLZ_05390 [Methylobacterium sp. CLZ]QIJ78968.1 hypothetical protein GU700_05390 [Methylobacterium sp. NI91]
MIAAIGLTLSACDEDGTRPAPDVHRLAANVHVSIAEHNLVLPFIALEEYAYRGPSFSLNPERDTQQASRAADTLLREAATPDHPRLFSSLAIVVRPYGLNDFDTRQITLCPLLTREWSRSVCDNPGAAVLQALPVNRFRLVDLREAQKHLNCVGEDRPRNPVPSTPRQATIVCRAKVYPVGENDFHTAAVRISGELGALWTVWGHGQFVETAEAMTKREGEAIVALVQHALGPAENFAALDSIMCRSRRPGPADSPRRADCPKG